jgi:hypothetical protein
VTDDQVDPRAVAAGQEIYEYVNSHPTIIPAAHYYAEVFMRHFPQLQDEAVQELIRTAERALPLLKTAKDEVYWELSEAIDRVTGEIK